MLNELRSVLTRFALAATLVAAAAAPLVGCAEEEADPCNDEPATVDGIAGVVMPPACNFPVSSATVVLTHGSNQMITVETDPNGEFAVPSSQLGGLYDRWGVSVTKGPLSSGGNIIVEMDGTNSTYQVVIIQ